MVHTTRLSDPLAVVAVDEAAGRTLCVRTFTLSASALESSIHSVAPAGRVGALLPTSGTVSTPR